MRGTNGPTAGVGAAADGLGADDRLGDAPTPLGAGDRFGDAAAPVSAGRGAGTLAVGRYVDDGRGA
ncbi:hypothetical protein Cci01nite_75310 [Catellatospora citrea]|uniref:Uncharacterized protein n=1 Tax=Catellatospora citrea TaxID=53366 RepID=A0A8J3KG96_9ACTN|nr:hypothetical protein Cci01nite_75310 [Catellatospora citrea]